MPDGSRQALTAGLSPADLRTLLLGVASARAAAVSPAEIMRRWQQDRLVRPASSDPRPVAALESRLWQLLPPAVEGVELSPLVPLGTCSALGPVSQNKIVTTMRSGEVVSDSTNALAVEAATRRHEGAAEVHLAASHRQLRAQPLGEGQAAHFRLFALVSSAPDAGSGATEARLLALHLGYWTTVFQTLLPAHVAPQVAYTVFGDPVVRERILDTVLPALSGSTAPVEEPERVRAQSYYTSAALRLTVRDGEHRTELGDGGFTSWTAQLLGNAKERCLISCVATERLAPLVGAASGPVGDR
jgi:hypothetical protein